MTFMELAKRRYAVRKYSDRQVSMETLVKILEAGNVAPTAMNFQPHRIRVLQKAEDLARLDELTHCRYGASTVLLFTYDADEDWKKTLEEGVHSGVEDVSIVATHIIVQIAPPREPATSGDSTTTESSADKTTAQEHHARRVEARTVHNEDREEFTATVEYDMAPNPGLTAGEIADRRNGIVGAINPNGRGKQATPYRPDEVPGDSGVMVEYAGSPDDMISTPPPPEDDLWGGPATPIPPENLRGIGGVRRVDAKAIIIQQ